MARGKYRIKADEVEIFPVFKDPEDKSIWNIVWEAYEKGKEKHKVGTISFAGEPERGLVTIKTDIEPEFIDRREARTALRAMTDWAFNQKKVYEIATTADQNDYNSVSLLESSGYVCRESKRGIESYSVIKQPTSWFGLYIFIGFVTGLVLCVVFDHIVIGITLGLFAGASVGSVLDQKELAARTEVTGEKTISKRKQRMDEIRKKVFRTESTEEDMN